MKNIKCLILCGGFGSRLREITKKTPKPLIIFKNKPFLEYLIENYKKKGIKSFVLSVYYKYKNFNLFKKYKIIKEKKKLGSGGAILNCIKKINKKNILVVNGDTLVKFSLKKLIRSHLNSNKALTVLAVIKKSQNRYGGFFKEKNLTTFKKNNKIGPIDCGIYLINKKKFLKYFIGHGNFEISKIINFFLGKNKINIHIQKKCDFIDIGLKKDLKLFNKNLDYLVKNF